MIFRVYTVGNVPAVSKLDFPVMENSSPNGLTLLCLKLMKLEIKGLEHSIVCSGYFSMSPISHVQIQLIEAKRQLETQVVLHQKTKELLNAAESELNTLRLQQGSSEARHTLSSPSTPTIRGRHKHTCTYREKYYHNRKIHIGLYTCPHQNAWYFLWF